MVIIFRQPGANIIDTVDGVRAVLPRVTAAISKAIDVDVVIDQTTTIRASVRDVERSLIISVILVILVVFAFLRSPRTAIIPSVAVPAVAHRHLRGHVSGRVQPRQPLAHGADHLHGFRRRRCDRGDRERHAVSGAGQGSVRGRAGRRRGNRLHRALDEPLAGGGVHSAAADGRDRRTPVPRIRRHDGDGDLDLDGGVADGHADDVRAPSQGARTSRPFVRLERACVQRRDPRVRPHARRRPAVRHRDAPRPDRHDRVDRVPVRSRPKGLLPAAGHGTPGRVGASRSGQLISGDERPPAAAHGDRQSRSGCGQRRAASPAAAVRPNRAVVHRLEAARRPQTRRPTRSWPGFARS